jgi:hypothetical protein
VIRSVSLAQHEIPVPLAEKAGLERRLVHRGGEPEYQFGWADDPAVLPVWDAGRFRLVHWGNRGARSRWLPCLPVTQLSTVEAGVWKPFRPRQVDIPASLILEGKVWTFIREGMRGLLVTDEAGVERVYIICEPATYYFRVMTRGNWMPVLIGERF